MRVASFFATFAISILLFGSVFAVQTRKTETPKGKAQIVTPSSDSVVWIDGVSHGKSGDNRTLIVSGLSVGSHEIRVRTVGFEDWNRRIVIAAGHATQSLVTQTRLDNDALLHLQKADAYRENNQQDEAITEYHTAIEQHGGAFPDAYVGLSRSLFAKGSSDDAIEAAKKAIKQKPTFAEAHAVLGNVFRQQGDYDSAAKEYESAIQLSAWILSRRSYRACADI